MTRPPRFDDLRPGRLRSFEMAGLVDVLVAATAAEVPGVLAAVEAAAARGLWAAGYVGYDAAPGLDPALRVVPGDGAAISLMTLNGSPTLVVPSIRDSWTGRRKERSSSSSSPSNPGLVENDNLSNEV